MTHADRQSRRRHARRDHRLAPRHARVSGAAIRRAPHRGFGGGKTQEFWLRRGGARHRPHRRRRRHPRPQGRRQGGGAARRHGCAAARGGDRPAVQVDGARQDARLRPRRPHRDAAGSRQIPRRDAQFRRHRGGDLPAGGGGRRRRRGHGEGRPHHPICHRRSLRHAQFSGPAGRRIRHPPGSDHGVGRSHFDRARRQRRPRGAAASEHRHHSGRRPDHQSAAIGGGAQRRSAGGRRGVDLHVPVGPYRQRHSAARQAARHGAGA